MKGTVISLGRRQLEMLQAAADDLVSTHHAGQGRMNVFMRGWSVEPWQVHVLERLLELDLLCLGEMKIAGHQVEITPKGHRALLVKQVRT